MKKFCEPMPTCYPLIGYTKNGPTSLPCYFQPCSHRGQVTLNWLNDNETINGFLVIRQEEVKGSKMPIAKGILFTLFVNLLFSDKIPQSAIPIFDFILNTIFGKLWMPMTNIDESYQVFAHQLCGISDMSADELKLFQTDIPRKTTPSSVRKVTTTQKGRKSKK